MAMRFAALLLLAHTTAGAFLGRAAIAPRRHPAVTVMTTMEPTATEQKTTIGSGKAAADAQQAEYFEMLPWEVPTRIELMGGKIKSSLDLRAFIQPFNRSGAVMTGVFVVQEGVPRSAYPQARNAAKVGWRPIGLVAALDKASIPMAIARQRGLIAAWANEYIRDYNTDAKASTSPKARHRRIAQATTFTTSMSWMMDKTWEGDLTGSLELEDDGVTRVLLRLAIAIEDGALGGRAAGGFRYVPIGCRGVSVADWRCSGGVIFIRERTLHCTNKSNHFHPYYTYSKTRHSTPANTFARTSGAPCSRRTHDKPAARRCRALQWRCH